MNKDGEQFTEASSCRSHLCVCVCVRVFFHVFGFEMAGQMGNE